MMAYRPDDALLAGVWGPGPGRALASFQGLAVQRSDHPVGAAEVIEAAATESPGPIAAGADAPYDIILSRPLPALVAG